MNIVADLHTHTIASGHAYSTLLENVEAAKKKGLQWLGMSDHAPALDDAPKETYFKNLKVVNRAWDNLQVLRGVELSVVDEYGSVDLPDGILETLDYAIASFHYPVYPHDKLHLCTEAAIAAMHNPYVFALGHPDDDLLPMDYEAIVNTASHCHVALEVNSSSLRPDSFRQGARENYLKMLTLAKEKDVSIILSSDSHIFYDIGNFSLALALLEEIGFPEELVINSSSKRLLDFFAYRQSKALSNLKAHSSLLVG